MEPIHFQQGGDWALFLSTFGLIFLAELPDKTAMAILILATQRHPWGIWVGVCLAYVVQNIVAILFGSVLGLLPPHWVHMGSGVLFILFALLMWFQREEKKGGKAPLASQADFLKSAWASFVVIFIAEWGDLTQLATATLVAKTRQPLTVFLASTSALWLVSGLFVVIGHHAKKIIRPRMLQTIAAVAFLAVGILLLTGFWDK
jgi:putative Ca2+/H+ antiporter (TMEM165/GDT1 family)